MPTLALLLMLVAPLARAAPYAYVANTGSNTVSVIDTATDTVVATVPVGNFPIGLAVSPDGRRVYVANKCASVACINDGTVSVIDTATDTVVATVPVGFFPIGVAVSPDGNRVYVTNSANGGAGTVSVIDTSTNSVTDTVSVGYGPTSVAISPDGSRVYVVDCNSYGCFNRSLSVIDTTTDAVTTTVPLGYMPELEGVAVSPDGKWVYVPQFCASITCSGTGTVSVIDTTTDTVTATVPVGYETEGVAVSPDGSRVYVANICGSSACSGAAGTVSMIDTTTDTVTATVPVGDAPDSVAVSPDGSRIYVTNGCASYVGCVNGTVSVIDAATDTVTATISVGANPSPLGNLVGPGALIATNSSTSGPPGTQVSGTVPALINTTTCAPSDAMMQSPARGNVTFDASTGSFTYTPPTSTYSGPGTFTWRGQAPGCTTARAPSTAVSNTATVSLKIDPLLTGLGNVIVGEGAGTQESFSLTGSTPFTHTLASDNGTVMPPAGVTVSPAACGTAGNLNCTLGLTAASVPGTAAVTMTMKDIYGDTVKKTVLVAVAAPPTESGLSNVSLAAGQSGSESFTDTGTGALTITASSSNTKLLPNSGITGQSSCASAGGCTLSLQPTSDQSGTSTVTVTVTDGYGQSATGSFDFAVQTSSPGGGGSAGSSGGGGFLSLLGLLMLLGLWGFVSLRRDALRGRC